MFASLVLRAKQEFDFAVVASRYGYIWYGQWLLGRDKFVREDGIGRPQSQQRVAGQGQISKCFKACKELSRQTRCAGSHLWHADQCRLVTCLVSPTERYAKRFRAGSVKVAGEVPKCFEAGSSGRFWTGSGCRTFQLVLKEVILYNCIIYVIHKLMII